MTEKELLSEMDTIEADEDDGWTAWGKLKDLLIARLSTTEQEEYVSSL
jgi:hypothetical protein